jgi:hypothetical protein
MFRLFKRKYHSCYGFRIARLEEGGFLRSGFDKL